MDDPHVIPADWAIRKYQDARRREAAEARVRMKVDIDQVGGMRGLMTRNVGDRLAAEYHRLMTSASEIALAAAWAGR